MAHRIMKQYSINQAELMEEEDKIARAERGGMSTVNIWPAKEGALVKHQTWVNDLVCAIRKFFDCAAYSTGLPDNIEWTFYGVVGHTISAAMAFEPVHNQIQTWAEKYPTVATRNRYSLGVADGLCRLAEEEKVAMENIARETEQKGLAARIRAEDIQRQVELDRIRNTPPSPSPEPDEENTMNIETDAVEGAEDASDNELLPDFNEAIPGENMDTTADFDTELMKFIEPDPKNPESDLNSSMFYQEPGLPSAKEEPREDPVIPKNEDTENKPEETTEWTSIRQLTIFRRNVKEIEGSLIKEKGLKLREGRKRKRSVKDRDAFRQGRTDAKDINIRAPRIEDGKENLPVVGEEHGG